jgi:hypothetical protein
LLHPVGCLYYLYQWCTVKQISGFYSASEDGRNHCPKHVELIGIINKPSLLLLVGCLYYLYQWCTVKQISGFFSAPEDGWNHRPKHVELIAIINKPLLLKLVGCLYYLLPTFLLKAASICIYLPMVFSISSLLHTLLPRE